MDILPVSSGENKAVFLPDKSCTDLEACIFISIMKYTCLGGGIKHINACILRHGIFESLKCRFQKRISFFIVKVIILDLPDVLSRLTRYGGSVQQDLLLCLQEGCIGFR